MKAFLLSIVCVFLLFSCNNVSDSLKEPTDFEKIINNEEGHFRGISIGDTIDFVLKNETSTLADSAPDYLFYDTNINDSDYYTISYQFDDSGLFEIMLDVNLHSQSKTLDLYTDFLNYFSTKYGTAQKIDNFEIWKISSNKSDKIEFALSQDSTENGEGHILLTLTNYDY